MVENDGYAYEQSYSDDLASNGAVAANMAETSVIAIKSATPSAEITWWRCKDDLYNTFYWYNFRTKESVWDEPSVWCEFQGSQKGLYTSINEDVPAVSDSDPHSLDWKQSLDKEHRRAFWYDPKSGRRTWYRPDQTTSGMSLSVKKAMAVIRIINLKRSVNIKLLMRSWNILFRGSKGFEILENMDPDRFQMDQAYRNKFKDLLLNFKQEGRNQRFNQKKIDQLTQELNELRLVDPIRQRALWNQATQQELADLRSKLEEKELALEHLQSEVDEMESTGALRSPGGGPGTRSLKSKIKELEDERKVLKRKISDKDIEIRSLTSKINHMEKSAVGQKSFSGSEDEKGTLIQLLMSQLKGANIEPILEVVGLEEAKERMKNAVSLMLQGDIEAEAVFDKWDTYIRAHPDYVRDEARKLAEWTESTKRDCDIALQLMLSYIPGDIFNISKAELIVRGVSPALARRIFDKKVLWWLRLPNQSTIAKMHGADLTYKYSMQGLDLVETQAVWAVVPDKFENDRSGEKEQWRQNCLLKLRELTKKRDKGTLAKKEVRAAAYNDQIGLFDPETGLRVAGLENKPVVEMRPKTPSRKSVGGLKNSNDLMGAIGRRKSVGDLNTNDLMGAIGKRKSLGDKKKTNDLMGAISKRKSNGDKTDSGDLMGAIAKRKSDGDKKDTRNLMGAIAENKSDEGKMPTSSNDLMSNILARKVEPSISEKVEPDSKSMTPKQATPEHGSPNSRRLLSAIKVKKIRSRSIKKENARYADKNEVGASEANQQALSNLSEAPPGIRTPKKDEVLPEDNGDSNAQTLLDIIQAQRRL